MEPRIAVIINAFNDSRFMINVCDRILLCGADEIIIVDDKSTDNTYEVFKNYSDKIKFIYNDGEKGVYGAFMKGLEYTNCEYISWLACDDELRVTNIEWMKKYIKKFPMIDLFCCKATVTREGNIYEKKLLDFDAYISPEYWAKIVKSGLSRQFTGCGSVVRRSLLLKCFKNCPIRTNLDCLYMYYTMFDKGFVYINHTMAMYRSYPTSFGNSLTKQQIKWATLYQIAFCKKNLSPEAYKLMEESGIYGNKINLLSQLAVWWIMKLPKSIRTLFYEWFYSYNWRIEKL